MNNHIFVCKNCYNPITFTLNDYMNSLMKKEEKLTNIIENIKKNEICDLCYEKLSEKYQNYSIKVDDDLEKIDKDINNFNEYLNNYENLDKILNLDIKEIKSREIESKNTLENLEKEYSQLNNDLSNIIKEYNSISLEEKKVKKELFNLEEDLIQNSKVKNQLKNVTLINKNKQKNLLKDNIYDIIFDIEIYEKYGTINGINMRIKEKNIIFKDLYCGWGYILNLTNFLIEKSNYFNNVTENNDEFKIIYLGDYSYIEDCINKKNYVLSSNNQDLNKKTKIILLNEFMEAYLKILKILSNKINNINNNNYTNTKKYTIGNKIINNYSIEIDIDNKNFNEENWNLCIKNLLIILKNYIKIILEAENKEIKNLL